MGRRTASTVPPKAAPAVSRQQAAATPKEPTKAAPTQAPAPDETEETGPPMSFESPESSTIAQASYDPDTHTLMVDFKGGIQHQGGKSAVEVRRYQYPGFELADWKQFMAAPSKGKFFSEIIRPIYVGREVKEVTK